MRRLDSMIRLRREQIFEGAIQSAGHTVNLVSAETAVSIETRWFNLGATYRRPAWVEMAGNNGDAHVYIRDPVMYAKIAALALPLAAMTRRLIR